jgi:O-antigen/teichoic acid export membrane protein
MITRNLAANLIGTAWSGALTIALVPLYVRLLGSEAYGLIAFFATLQALSLLFDAGVGTATNRELAVLSAGDRAAECRSLIRTAEVLYWGAAGLIFVLAVSFGPLLAEGWFHPQHLTTGEVSQSLRLAGMAVALQFPFTLYSSGLLGLQRHVVLNSVIVTSSTVRAVGAVAVILLTRDITWFFAWQLIASAGHTAAAGIALHAVAPGRQAQVRFDFGMLSHAWRFIRGLAAVMLLAAIATQIDKLTVSKLLPLGVFGAYGVAGSIAAVLPMLAAPIGASFFPRFTQLVHAADATELSITYNRAVQVAAVILVPVAAMAVLFGRELVLVWTGSGTMALALAPVVALLVSGSALNALLNLPYTLQLANAWTAPAIRANVAAIIFLAVAVPSAVHRFGLTGAAACWLVANAGFFIYGAAMTHRHLLPVGDAARLLRDVLPIIAAALTTAAIGRATVSGADFKGAMFPWLVVIGVVSALAAAAASPAIRTGFRDFRISRRAQALH